MGSCIIELVILFFLFNNKIPLETFVTIFLSGSMLPEGSELPKLGHGQIRLKKRESGKNITIA